MAEVSGGRTLRVVVAALGADNSEPRANVRHGLSLVRSAALYADEVSLLSAGAELLGEYQQRVVNMSPGSILEIAERNSELAARLSQVPDLAARLNDISAAVRRSQGLWASEFKDLQVGRQRNVLSIEPFLPPSGEDASPDEGSPGERFMQRFTALINTPGVHVLLDAGAARYARAVRQLQPDWVESRTERRHLTAEVGAGMITRLPAFPTAPLDELLDFKAELQTPLVRYRAAVARIATTFEAHLGDPDLDDELDAEWVATVNPAITDLQEEMCEHSFVRELAAALSSRVERVVVEGAGLYVALSALGHVADQVAAMASSAGIAFDAIATAATSRRGRRRTAERSDYYYLYELNRRASCLSP